MDSKPSVLLEFDLADITRYEHGETLAMNDVMGFDAVAIYVVLGHGGVLPIPVKDQKCTVVFE